MQGSANLLNVVRLYKTDVLRIGIRISIENDEVMKFIELTNKIFRIVTFAIGGRRLSCISQQRFFPIRRIRLDVHPRRPISLRRVVSGYLTFELATRHGIQPVIMWLEFVRVVIYYHCYRYCLYYIIILFCGGRCRNPEAGAIRCATRGTRGARDDRPLHDEKNMTITVVILSRR